MIVSGKVALAVMLVAIGLGFVVAAVQSPSAGDGTGNDVVYVVAATSVPENKSE